MNREFWPLIKKRIKQSIRREIARLQSIRRRDVLITLPWCRRRETGMPYVQPLRETYCIGSPTRFRVASAINWRRTMLDSLPRMPTFQVFSRIHVTYHGQIDPVLAWFDNNRVSRLAVSWVVAERDRLSSIFISAHGLGQSP